VDDGNFRALPHQPAHPRGKGITPGTEYIVEEFYREPWERHGPNLLFMIATIHLSY
jgi:hypothetical protein